MRKMADQKKKRQSPKRDWDALYGTYKEKYLAKAQKHTMFSPMLSKYQFAVTYTATRNYMKEIGQKPNNIIRSMVSKQEYQLSYKQAQALVKAFEYSTGEKTTVRKIRSKGKKAIKEEFWDQLSSLYKSMVRDGMSPKTASLEISRAIFGSKV